LLAREHRPEAAEHAVDFWARPLSDINYDRHLPAEIARGAISFGLVEPSDCRRSSTMIEQHLGRGWPDKPCRYSACSNGVESLTASLRALLAGERSSSRTALLALDSQSCWPEPAWAEVIPAFRSCYDRIIGHFHLERRGLRQWRDFLNTSFPAGYFQEFFTDAVMQCDAVVLTSSALCESDVRCCPRASTEELAGKLIRDFGCALLTPEVLERITFGNTQTSPRKPRMFALASMGLWTMDDYYIHHHVLFDRQRDLVTCSFGDDSPGEPVLFVATAVEDLHSEMVEEIRQRANGTFFTSTIPAYEVDKSKPSYFNYLRMITLWPFKLGVEEPRAT
jgi:hypothetical protein